MDRSFPLINIVDPKYTVIIDHSMHGIVTAIEIYRELNKQFDGHIIHVSIDVDQFDYPIGMCIVSFDYY